MVESSSESKIFEATLGANGVVKKGKEISLAQAEGRRRVGLDVVVCGDDLSTNRRLAGQIEQQANGQAKRCPPHANAGSEALPHWQPDPRPPDGHTFYETQHRKAHSA